MHKEYECKYKLNKLGVGLCKSSSFAYLIESMLRLMDKQLNIAHFFDVSYFFWLIKFVISRFVLKNLEIHEQINKYKRFKKSSLSHHQTAAASAFFHQQSTKIFKQIKLCVNVLKT